MSTLTGYIFIYTIQVVHQIQGVAEARRMGINRFRWKQPSCWITTYSHGVGISHEWNTFKIGPIKSNTWETWWFMDESSRGLDKAQPRCSAGCYQYSTPKMPSILVGVGNPTVNNWIGRPDIFRAILALEIRHPFIPIPSEMVQILSLFQAAMLRARNSQWNVVSVLTSRPASCHHASWSVVLWVFQCPLRSAILNNRQWEVNIYYLVVSTPLKNISQLGWLFPIFGNIKKHNPNQQSV